MAGWRIGMAVGNPRLIDALHRMKSNLDSGVPRAIQKMAVVALKGPRDVIEEHNKIYQRRRDKLVRTLNSIGINARPPQASLYIWAKVPEGYSSAELAGDLLEPVGVVVTPGTAYGPSGEDYIRLSLTIPDEMLEGGLERLVRWRRR
jgi:LL-diaminopimelate aminotransferase